MCLSNLDLKLLMVSCARWSGVRRKHKVSFFHSHMTHLQRSDAANFDFKACPELAAREYQISLKSKLPHLASILDGHFVAGYRIWEGLGRIGS